MKPVSDGAEGADEPTREAFLIGGEGASARPETGVREPAAGGAWKGLGRICCPGVEGPARAVNWWKGGEQAVAAVQMPDVQMATKTRSICPTPHAMPSHLPGYTQQRLDKATGMAARGRQAWTQLVTASSHRQKKGKELKEGEG